MLSQLLPTWIGNFSPNMVTFNAMGESFQMFDSDSDIENVSSQPESYDFVPEILQFKFKICSSAGEIRDKFSYDLKKGKKLPYAVNLKDKLKAFSLYYNH